MFLERPLTVVARVRSRHDDDGILVEVEEISH